jgi:microcompartment protein CcmL/EutN
MLRFLRFSLFNRSLAVAVVMVAGFAAVACTPVLVAPNTKGEYKLGELQVMVDGDFSSVHEAVTRGIKDAGLFQTRDDRKAIEAEVNARDSTDTLVIVKIKEIAPKRMSVKIRYGLKGDLAAAQRLYQAIEKHL